MRRRDKLGGKTVKAQRSKTTLTRGKRKVAHHRKTSPADATEKIALLERRLNEALEQQAATSEVLSVISGLAGELQPVFETMLARAVDLCDAKFGTMLRAEEDGPRVVAMHGAPLAYAEERRRNPVLHIGPTNPLVRLAESKQLLHISDIRLDPAYRDQDRAFVQLADFAGARTLLMVPMLKQKKLIGAVAIYRQEVRPFTDKQIELVNNFASQAVIAIENARLLNELRKRTDDLSEALEQQTATSEVLQVISSSPGHLEPVFDAMLASAVRICEAEFGVLFRCDGSEFFPTAWIGVPTGLMDYHRQRGSFRPADEAPLGRLLKTKDVIYTADESAEPNSAAPASKLGGARSLVAVPMLKQNDLIGAIIIYRQEVRPFSEKQIGLVKNFAAQAVIAIENARLLNELRESLQQQTTTADVLKVISRSTFDLQTVLQTLVESVVRLCDGYDSVILLRDGELLVFGAHHGPIPMDFDKWPLTRKWTAGRAVIDAKPVHIRDLTAAADELPDGHAMAVRLGHRTILSVPLLRESEAIGSLTVRRSEVRPFTDKQIELVSTFADQAVIAIENARLLNELRESLAQQTTTADVLKVISRSTFDLQTVLDTLTESATRLCAVDQGVIFLRDGDVLRLRASFGFPAEAVEYALAHPMLPNRGSATGRVALEGRPVHIHDVLADPEYRISDYQKMFGYRTVLSVPLLRDGATVGVFALTRSVVEPFSDKQIELVSTFADQAVIAIENARLLNELRESLQQQTATSDVLKVISSSLNDLKPVFETIGQRAEKLCDAEISVISIVDGDSIRLVSINGVNGAGVDAVRQIFPMRRDAETVTARTIRSAAICHIPDVLADPIYEAKDTARASEFRGCLGVPMIRDGQVIGMIFVARKYPGPFADSQIQLLKTFADQAVIAIENARLFNETNEALERQTATADVLKAISRSTFDLGTVLQTLVEAAARLCDADQGTIAREHGGAFTRAASYGFSADFVELVSNLPVEPARGSATGRALLEGRTVHIPDVEADADYTFSEAKELGGFRTILAVPMLRDGKAIGVLALTRIEVRPFSEKQIELVTTFADQAAIAIENVRLFESVEARTRELVKSLEELRTAQDRLVQTEKLASLGQLTAGIAHEIKNPLNFVNNFSAVSAELVQELQETLAHANLDPKLRAQIEELSGLLQSNLAKVVQHGKRADGIVKNMLLHSRAGSGERRLVDINAVVEESLNLAYHGARAEKQGFNITIERSFDSAAGQIDLYPQEITRVLLNLISNGFYATTNPIMEADGIEYQPVLLATTKNLGDQVEIIIRDNGTGIPPEIKEKMFNPFFTTKPAGEGTGLGLSISHDIIVKQHAGRLEVDTQPGKFTEFRIILPRTAALLAQGGGQPGIARPDHSISGDR